MIELKKNIKVKKFFLNSLLFLAYYHITELLWHILRHHLELLSLNMNMDLPLDKMKKHNTTQHNAIIFYISKLYFLYLRNINISLPHEKYPYSSLQQHMIKK